MKAEHYNAKLVTADFNIGSTNQADLGLILNDKCKNDIIGFKFLQMLRKNSKMLNSKKPIDILFTTNPNMIINTNENTELNLGSQIISFQCETICKIRAMIQKKTFNIISRQQLNNSFSWNLYRMFRFSDVDKLVEQWHQWFEALLFDHVPKTNSIRFEALSCSNSTFKELINDWKNQTNL